MPFIGPDYIIYLPADQQVTNSAALVDLSNFIVNLPAGKSFLFQFTAVFTIGAAGGFRFNFNNSVAVNAYNLNAQAYRHNTTTFFNFNLRTTAADFTNASAVASDMAIRASGFITAAALCSFKVRFAQNAANATPIIIRAGAWLRCTFV